MAFAGKRASSVRTENGMAKAIFLDRDGVFNELVYYPDFGEDESPREPAHLRLLTGVIPALQQLQLDDWTLFLVSNQPSYAKGKTSLQNLKAVHAALETKLAESNIRLKSSYYSYTHPRGVVPEYTTESVYRKPHIGFLLEAARDFEVDLAASWMVGDRDTDVECGKHAGTHTAQILYPLSKDKQGKSSPDVVCKDLADFARYIVTTEKI